MNKMYHETCCIFPKYFRDQIMTLVLLMCYFMKSTHVSGVRNITHGVSKHILFALGIPIDIPDKSIAMAFYFEANYGLPYEWNSSYFYEADYYAKRSLSRQLVYRMLMNKMESLGYSGLDCLLRTICEAGRYSLSENGVLGDILQIVLTPSTSRSENLPDEIIEAEHEQHCDQRYKKCSVNPLDLISHYISSN
ncbi:uncharacterized protein LOC114928447 isoform X2 [Nylanderia fulva]|uniref:uncharacterized protein LOC114928447 isoform X2 n=1 Tax=Nylanderia fulva TaxID=613905 RepID=UPI0010FB2E92|nr:uncharacterized protein LOC114928447 isoform X2 [Nylanderia fulva]